MATPRTGKWIGSPVDLFGSEYRRPWIATPGQALDYVDCGPAAAEHQANPTLRASGLDESLNSATPQAAENVPAAIQLTSLRLQAKDKVRSPAGRIHLIWVAEQGEDEAPGPVGPGPRAQRRPRPKATLPEGFGQ